MVVLQDGCCVLNLTWYHQLPWLEVDPNSTNTRQIDMIVCRGKFKLLGITTRGNKRSPFTMCMHKSWWGTTGFAYYVVATPSFFINTKYEFLVILLFKKRNNLIPCLLLIIMCPCAGKKLQFYTKRYINIQLSL